MFYYASLNTITFVCDSVFEYEEEQETHAYFVEIDSYDTSLIYRKKYINGEWVDALPSESGLPQDCKMVHKYGADDRFLSEALGELATLETTDKTSLVDAVNECFQSASDGKTAIANAITGVDSGITIPENPTFAQLSTLIEQLGTLRVETGSMSAFTIPATIEGTTSFRPKIVIVYNFGSGLSNFNMGVYVSPEITGNTTQQISDSANGIGNTLSRRASAFTITDTGFTMINTGAVTTLKWIALG